MAVETDEKTYEWKVIKLGSVYILTFESRKDICYLS